MDAQDLINDLGDGQSAIFIEGESEYEGNDNSMHQITEDDEFNNSMENRRSTFKKKPRSMDGLDDDEAGEE